MGDARCGWASWDRETGDARRGCASWLPGARESPRRSGVLSRRLGVVTSRGYTCCCWACSHCRPSLNGRGYTCCCWACSHCRPSLNGRGYTCCWACGHCRPSLAGHGRPLSVRPSPDAYTAKTGRPGGGRRASSLPATCVCSTCTRRPLPTEACSADRRRRRPLR